VSEPHSEEDRFEFQQQLENTMKWTSRSVGRLMIIGQQLKQSSMKKYFKETIIPFARNCLGTDIIDGCILTNHAILLYFVCQVRIFVWM
jgi:hypothetical protein